MAQPITMPLGANDNTAKPGVGHNVKALTPEEMEALYLTHLQACRLQNATLEKAMETVRAVRKIRNQVRHTAKSDGFPLGVIDEVLKAEGRSRGDLQIEQDLRRSMWTWAGLPVGGQGDLFLNMPEEIKDGIQWEAEGYASGIRAEEPSPPPSCPPRFMQDWLKGYGNGQERNAWALSERGKIVDRNVNLGASHITLDPVNDDGELVQAAG